MSLATPKSNKPRLTRNQIRGFWAAWGGWALDGMDSFIYAMVLVPALRELLPRSGIPATTANVGFYGGVLFACFLVGWGLSLVWGPIADRFGRVRTLSLTIIFFSVFTLLSALATSVWSWRLSAWWRALGSEASGQWRAHSWRRNGPRNAGKWARDSCIPATISAFFWRRSPTIL